MPPKPKYTKDEIVTAAYELTRENGIDAVVARAVGARLGTSASPIFTVFNSMDELKDEVYEMAKTTCLAFMDGIFDFSPSFKEFGMRWVRFSLQEPHLYRLLFLHMQKGSNPYSFCMELFSDLFDALLDDCCHTFRIQREDAKELLNQMLIHSNGIATFAMDDPSLFDETKISASISQVCIGLVLGIQLREGCFSEPQAKAMALSSINGILPQKKKND